MINITKLSLLMEWPIRRRIDCIYVAEKANACRDEWVRYAAKHVRKEERTSYHMSRSHYENMPIQIYRKFHLQKLKIFRYKNSDIFHISAQNIDCGYSLEPPQRGGSNEYPQSMLLSRNKKNDVYPYKPQFYYIEMGFKGSKLYRHVFVMTAFTRRLHECPEKTHRSLHISQIRVFE